jgi:SAM-dependent MidA family methyltransferase
MTVAAFMEFALYDPQFGYYAREPRRSGRAGDFFTSVDVGPLFGNLLEIELAEMCGILESSARPAPSSTIDLVEAGAGDGRLSADVLRAARRRHPALYRRLALHLVEASERARLDHQTTLGPVADRLSSSSPDLPASFEGVLVANELLDAFPAHRVKMRPEGLAEVYIDLAGQTGPGAPATDRQVRLTTREGPLSTQALATYLPRVNVALRPGWYVDINLRAVEWVREAARRLRRGFLIVIDYGHDAQTLYSSARSSGTLAAYAAHRLTDGSPDEPGWLEGPGTRDITTHVDFTSVRAAAEAEGLVTLGFLDQTYFLLALAAAPAAADCFESPAARRALMTLVMPGSLGSTHKVLILGKDVGRPVLCGCSVRQRVT